MHLSLCSFHLFIQFPSASLNICAASCSSRRRRRRQKLGKYLGWCKVFLVRELHQGRPFKVVSTVPQNSKNSKNSKVGSHDIMTIDIHRPSWRSLGTSFEKCMASVRLFCRWLGQGISLRHYVTNIVCVALFSTGFQTQISQHWASKSQLPRPFPTPLPRHTFLETRCKDWSEPHCDHIPKKQKIKLLSHKVTQCHVALPDCFPLPWCLKPFLGDSSRNAGHLADRTADLSLKNGNEKSRTWYGMITKY